MSNEQIVNQPNLYVDGLNLARASNTTFTMAAGAARDSGNVYDIVVDSALTCNMAVVGANGIDAGAIGASKLYYVYVIGDSLGFNAPASLISLSSSPVMPAGYDVKRIIGYMHSSAGSALLAGYWYGDRNERVFNYDAPQATAVTAGNATSYTAVDLSTLGLVPPVENLPVMIAYQYTPASAGNDLNLTPGNATGNAVTINGQVGAVIISGNVEVMAKVTSSVSEIDYKVGNGSDAVALNVAGYRLSI